MGQQSLPGAVSTRDSCRVCGARGLTELLDFGLMPLAGGFVLPGDEERAQSFPLRLVRCAKCTLMQVPDVVDPEVIFRQYSYASSTTRTLTTHFERMAAWLAEVGLVEGQLVVEFGCNDGVLIRPLQALGAIAVGVDPSDVALRASKEQGWPLVPGYFSETTALEVRRRFGAARVVTANNTFAHADDLDTLMRGVDVLLEDEGLFVFEVHYQGDLVRATQFDTVYHEHLCYYSVRALEKLLERFRFRITDVHHIPVHSGSIRVVAVRKKSNRSREGAVDEAVAAEERWDIVQFVRRVQDRRESVRHLVQDLRRGGCEVAAYGAAGRATILLNYCGLGSDLISYVVDESPLRYGRMVPGVLVPVQPPSVFRKRYPAYALLTAWNYEEEVVRKETIFLEQGGRFIVPLPEIRVVGLS